MKRSDEILALAMQQGRSLTTSERVELKESYNHEQKLEESARHKVKESVKSFKDGTDVIDRPRHIMAGTCAEFIECPIDYKCRNYNPKYMKCVKCILHETDDICLKSELHTDANFSLIIQRERIDLDGK